MFRFFRDLRRRLIMPDSIRKYVLYALGEILLVMIGIVFALQVNNWNENRKAIISEKELLSGVLESLKEDSVSYERIINALDYISELHRNIHLYRSGQIGAEQITDLPLIRRSSALTPITRSNYPDLANRVRSEALRVMVLKHYQVLDRLNFVEDSFNTIIEDQVRSYLAEKELLNFAYHFQQEGDSIPMIHHDRFIQELNNEAFIQILFNVHIKIGLLKNNAKQLLDQNSILVQEINKSL